MRIKIPHRISKALDKTNKPPVFIFRIYKRHIFVMLAIVAAVIFGYAAYFKFFLVLPQSSINVMPAFPYPIAGQRVLIVSPHCDDETLGSAGLMQQALKAHDNVRVAIVTDCNHHHIGQVRKEESITALSSIGLSKDKVDFLDFPEVESSKKNNPAGLNLEQALDREISEFQPTIIVSPHPEDTHIDHKSSGLAIRDLVSKKYTSTKVAYYLIHYNFMRYPSPSGFHPDDYLLPPARLINLSQRWYILDLSQDEEEAKQEAVFKYKSQLNLKNPILHEILLDFVRENELFMVEGK